MRTIAEIGIETPTAHSRFKLASLTSLSDTDIVIFCPDFKTTSYSNHEGYSSDSGYYQGKTCWNKESSARVLEHTQHWKNELLNFVSNGGTLFFILNKKEDYFYYTGTNSVSGTGRNQKVTNHVAPISNYNCIPFKFAFNSAAGNSIVAANPLVKEFFDNFKDLMSYEVYLSPNPSLETLFTTKNGDRVLGAVCKIGKGHVVFIPNLSFQKSGYSIDTRTAEKWTKKAIQKGNQFTAAIVEIDKSLNQLDSKTPKPIWADDDAYALMQALQTYKLIQINIEECARLNAENEVLSSVLSEQQSLKDLLFENGKLLERAVIKALIILGYEAENYDDGTLELDQIILSPEGSRLIGECEGKDSKDIDVSKFRQLLDNLNADFEKDEVAERASGLLFGNPQRLVNPNERTLTFTAKCKTGASREKIGLILTTDLFRVAKYVMENNDEQFAKNCREAIINQLGNVINFPSIPIKEEVSS
ncbi:hypothetical protein [Mucilaginibacter sp. HD30]